MDYPLKLLLFFQILQHVSGNSSEISQFIKVVVSSHFPKCYGIRILHEIPSNFQDYSYDWAIPQMEIIARGRNGTDIEDIEHAATFLRFGHQCIVYEVDLMGQDHNEGILNFFLTSLAERRSKHSYIFINEYMNIAAARKFIMEPSLRSYPHRVLPEVTVIASHEESESFGIFLNVFCYFCDSGKPSILPINRIHSLSDGVSIKSIDEVFPDVTNNLNGLKLRVTAPPAPPLVLIVPSPHSEKYEIHGQQENILYGIGGKYNFSCFLYPVPGGSTGSRLKNGTWTGVMGEILYGRADIGLAVGIDYDRREIADFTSSTFYAFLVLVSTKPIPVFEWQSIFYPFKVRAWFAVTATTVVIILLFRGLHNKSLFLEVPARKAWRSKFMMMHQIKSELMTGFRAFYLTVGSLLEQGLPRDYNTMPSRMIATFWMFFAIIISCAYRSKLFSFLISPTIETPPSTFMELLASDYSWGMKSLGGIALLFITKSPIQYIRTIGERMEISTDLYSCLDKTFYDAKFTCIIYKAYVDYMMEIRYWKLKHQFYVSDFVTPPVGSAWSLARHSPLKKNFDEMSYRIHEMGLADKFLYDYQVSFAKSARANENAESFSLNKDYKNDDDTGPRPLEMENLYGGFFILGLGIFFSAIILLAEYVKRHREIVLEKSGYFWGVIRKRFRKASKKMRFPQLVQLIVPNHRDFGTTKTKIELELKTV